jgi:cadmium resistance protein CadD (predicted permease)
MGIAIAAVFILPDLPSNTRGFTADELEVAQLRMTEDVGLADVDPEGLGTFGGLRMALKDVKVYIMCLIFTLYVVGLSFNAYFVSCVPRRFGTIDKLTHTSSHP